MHRSILLSIVVLGLFGLTAQAQVPQIINYQGRVVVGTTNFNGTGQFKFALVNSNGTTTYWSNDGTSTAGSQPTAAVSLTVNKGLYSVLLGDTTIANMTVAIPASVFNNSDVRLRVWFNDGTTGSQLLTPDQRIASTGYAMTAGTVPDNTITSAKIAPGAVTSAKIGNGAVGSAQIANGGVSASQIADSSITSAKIGSGQVVKSVNGLSDAVTLSAGDNISITPSGNTLTLSATGGDSGFWLRNNTGSPYYNGGGFVGIGTDSPAAGLHIMNSSGNALRLDGGAPRINFIDTGNANALTAIGAQAGSFYVANGQMGTLLQLTANGRMGLGTEAPRHQLSIRSLAGGPTWTSNGWAGAIDMDNGSAIAWGANSGGTRFGMGHTNGAFYMFRTGADPGTTGNSAVPDFTITDGGNIGVGTTSPLSKLHVAGNDPAWVEAAVQNTGGRTIVALNSTINGSNRVWSIENGLFGTAGLFGIYDRTAAQARMTIDTAGNMGVGTNAPVARLQVSSSGNLGAPQAQLTQNISGEYARLRFSATGSPTTWDIAGGTAGGVMNFYASSTNRNVMNLNPNGTVSVGVLNITGGADLAEPFPMAEGNVPPGAVVCIDPKSPGKLRMSRRAYDKRAAGIVSGANGIKPGISMIDEELLEAGENVSLSGRVYVKANRSGGAIEPGDLLTTSEVPGEAMRAADNRRAQGAVIGKAMTPLEDEKGMVLVLVTLQ